MGITSLIGDLMQAFGGVSRSTSPTDKKKSTCLSTNHDDQSIVNASMAKALITVFGMESNGRIKKEKARRVVAKLGLISNPSEEDNFGFDLPGDDEEVPIKEALGELDDDLRRNELLYEAFKIFDEDGNGFIDAVELKRVLQCLGLDSGWNMDEIEKMLRVVDLNLDGKVDFYEFELMMGVNCH